MTIRILKGCSGRRFSYRQGEVVDVNEVTGRDLVGGGLAEEVKETKSETKAETKTKSGAKKDVNS
jgi:hypothetical protein